MATSYRNINFKYKDIGNGRYRPIIPIEIGATDTLYYEVLVDSGADYCIFNDEVAEAIGIEDITTGVKFKFGGVTGKSEVGYSHTETIAVKDCSYQTKVGFSASIRDDGIGIVGQKGFFDRFAIKFDHSKKDVILRKKKWA